MLVRYQMTFNLRQIQWKELQNRKKKSRKTSEQQQVSRCRRKSIYIYMVGKIDETFSLSTSENGSSAGLPLRAAERIRHEALTSSRRREIHLRLDDDAPPPPLDGSHRPRPSDENPEETLSARSSSNKRPRRSYV